MCLGLVTYTAEFKPPWSMSTPKGMRDLILLKYIFGSVMAKIAINCFMYLSPYTFPGIVSEWITQLMSA